MVCFTDEKLTMLFVLNVFLGGTLLPMLITGQQCQNDLGEPVDWFLAYKPPALKVQSNDLLQKGVGYLYATAKDQTSNWKLSSESVNDSTSFLGRTLSPLYTDSAKSLLYIIYNDEPPSSAGSTVYGHSKGVVITDGKTGLWLVHSSPKFPIEPVTDVSKSKNSSAKAPLKNKYFFPKTATRFGQSFLCITLSPDQMDKVGNALQYIRPKIYGQNVPSVLAEKFPELSSVANNKFKQVSKTFKATLKTLGGRQFVSYAKAKDFNQDLYTGWLAPDLKSDLQVETWSNGPNELPSDCKTQYRVMDVKDVEIKFENQVIRFKNSQDHSKWAVTINSNITTLCIGDINRMLAQFKRGGGTVCYQNARVWKRYSKAVADVQPCTVLSKSSNETLPHPSPPPIISSGSFDSPSQPNLDRENSKNASKVPGDQFGAKGHFGSSSKDIPHESARNPEIVTTPKTDAKKKQKSFISRFVDKLFGFPG